MSEQQRVTFNDRLLDLRFLIACLFTIFGVMVTITGLRATPEDIEKAAGVNISLWTGIGLLLLAGSFWLWVLLSPPQPATSSADLEEAAEHEDPWPSE
ncbi:MAG: hypothetical protein KDC39_06710 [Actinobacteria bacterium]|nr:hypothetical protein [Actinomycetota bacterium]